MPTIRLHTETHTHRDAYTQIYTWIHELLFMCNNIDMHTYLVCINTYANMNTHVCKNVRT